MGSASRCAAATPTFEERPYMSAPKISRRAFLAMSATAAASFALDWTKIDAFAASMGPKKDYPTVVIGSGLGGLTAAAFLARQGIPVTVLERHNVPGGYATSFERAEGRFDFEVSLHATAAGNGNAEERILRYLGVWDKVQFALLPEQYSVLLPDGSFFRAPQKDPDGYARLLSALFPHQGPNIARFVRFMTDVAGEGKRVMRKNPTLEGASFYASFPFEYPNMFSLGYRTLEEVLKSHGITDPRLISILAVTWPYYGLPPSRLSANYFISPAADYLLNGAFYVRRRSQDLSNALADAVTNHGGEIIYGAEAERIHVENGAVTGVTAAGTHHPARAVVSNASAPATFFNLLPEGAVPKSYRKKLESYRVGLSSFIVWLGLDRDITETVKDYEIFVSSGRSPEADYDDFLAGRVSECGFLVAVYDNAYKGYSRPGTSTVSIVILSGYEPWRRFEADYDQDSKEAYLAEKERWTEILIRRAEERVIPGLSKMIAVKDSATPLTNRRYTGNPGGAIYGYDHGVDNDFVNRIDNRTPVRGLYLASAWGNPGAGYGGTIAGAEVTFYKMMKDWGG